MSPTNFKITQIDVVAAISTQLDRGLETSKLVYGTVSDFHDELVDVAFYILNDHWGGVEIDEDGDIPFDTFSDCDPDEVMDRTMFDYRGGYLNASGYCGEAENYELGLASLTYMSHTFKNVSDFVKRGQN